MKPTGGGASKLLRALAPQRDRELVNEHLESLEIADREGVVALPGAALLGVASRDCLVLGDTAAGIESARRAGMQVVALDTTYPARALAAADALAGTLADVQIQVREDEMTVTVADKQGRNE